MNVNRSKAERNLPRKGFQKDPSGDHIYFYHHLGGKETGPYTKLSHSKKLQDIGDKLLSKMKRQLELDSNRQVANLLECPMDGDEYKKILIDKGLIESDG